MASQLTNNKKSACVTGGTGFLASSLIKMLLENGYAVNTTVRDPDNEKKISHLIALQELGDLKIFKADLTDEESFIAPTAVCDFVFHVATPINFASKDPENDMIKPAIQGVQNVLKSCAKSKTVKRVIMTSSAAALSINKLTGTGLLVDEECWTDVDFLTSEKPHTWGYPVSKTLAEKEAWKIAQENKIDLITIIPTLITGPAITPDIPSSVNLTTSLITGNEVLINELKVRQLLSGYISMTHVDDVCRAHIFLAEKQSASGRYVCNRINTSVPELSKFLAQKFQYQYKGPTEFGDFPSKSKVIISSAKLVSAGFSFKYGMEEIYEQSMDYLKGMSSQAGRGKRACVIGGTGFLASWMVKLLLQRGYAVNTAVRDPDNLHKISHLKALQQSGDLRIFGADLRNEQSFDVPIAGCELVFLVATPVNFASQDPENDMIKPAIQGVHNVLKACAKASKTVKRVILTSSAAAISINKRRDTGFIVDEEDWTDVEFLTSEKPPTWGYPVSKTLAEKAAWKFAQENNIDLITVTPSLMTGPALTPDVPESIMLAASLITGNEFLINGLKGMELLSGSISITHVEDVCRAHIFLAETKSASGRYVCCGVNSNVTELAKFLNKRYPQYQVPTEFEDFPSKAKLMISSDKLIREGFRFNYGIEEIYDHTLEYLKAKRVLN